MIGLATLVESFAADVGGVSQAAWDTPISGLVEDSRQVQAGDGYVAVKGAQHDGHDFAPQAVANGAVAILAERRLNDLPVPVCVVPHLSAHRSALAAKAYGDPSRTLNCTAVTGTNGKTSVAHYLAQLLALLQMSERLSNAADKNAQAPAGARLCGYMGTLGWGLLPTLTEANLTTVDACSVQQRLAHLNTLGCKRVAMEVSSHALVQQRVAAVHFKSAIFTNLSRDHLDYHGDMESYAAAKRSLFDFASLERIVTNVDDPYGRAIGESKQGGAAKVYTYGVGSAQRNAETAASVSWRDIQVTPQGFAGYWRTAWGDAPLELPLLGRFAIANVAAAITLLLSEGWPLAAVAEACTQLECVPGRMQQFHNPQLATVVVDFAHTPDALQQAAQSLREHCQGNLHIVFGCGGDRDRGKRAQMGRAAAASADSLWLTDDNPRSEDPAQIVADIVSGLPASGAKYQICHDRAQAIANALAACTVKDVVLVAGKGHETYQERNGKRSPYSDLDCVAELLGPREGGHA